MKRLSATLATIGTLALTACAGKPAKEAVLLVGRDVNPNWSTVFQPALAAPDREITVLDVARQSAADALKPWLAHKGQRLIIVPLTVSTADPMVPALQAAVGDRPGSVVVPPPEDSTPMVTGVAQRALRMSQRRSQEGLWVVMDLPPGADPRAAQATADKVAQSLRQSADFRPIVGVVWQGAATVDAVKTAASKVGRPLVVTYATNPVPLATDIRNRLHGVRYYLDGEGVMSDPFFQDWLREAVGKGSLSAANPPRP